MDFRRFFVPSWMLEMERLSKEEAARNLPQPSYSAWANVLVVLGGIAVSLGMGMVFVATPGRHPSSGVPPIFAWYGLVSFLLGFAVIVLARRFGKSKPPRIDGDNAEP